MTHNPFTCTDVACAECHGLEAGPTEADLAVVARIGGNEYRRRLDDLVTRRQPLNFRELDRWIAQDAESLAEGRSYQVGRYSQPWHYTDTEGGYHESPAMYHGLDSVQSAPRHQTTVPEAAFTWPIYWSAIRGLER